jgi:hypothetical protein
LLFATCVLYSRARLFRREGGLEQVHARGGDFELLQAGLGH